MAIIINRLNTGTLTIGSAAPVARTNTIFTLQGGTTEEYDIVGELSVDWFNEHGFHVSPEEGNYE